jgi:hypothetical protein
MPDILQTIRVVVSLLCIRALVAEATSREPGLRDCSSSKKATG